MLSYALAVLATLQNLFRPASCFLPSQFEAVTAEKTLGPSENLQRGSRLEEQPSSTRHTWLTVANC